MINRTEEEIMRNWMGDVNVPMVSVRYMTYNVEALLIGVMMIVLGVCILDNPSDVSKMKTSISKKQKGCNSD
ncbi:MAG: hypothetical protein U0I22_06300 [Treponema sp.]|nr:hypothetical protein [Treponema sp.]